MSSFDFNHYLHAQVSELANGTSRFEVEILVGGVTNHTARITFDPELSISRLPTNLAAQKATSLKSVILKHASPFVAAFPNQKLPVTRQIIEKRALEILNGEAQDFPEMMGKLAAVGKGRIRVPELIWHDDEEDVLWIEDLGRMRTLSSVLLDESMAEGRDDEHLVNLAQEFGTFLAEMHKATFDPPKELLVQLASLHDRAGLTEMLVNITREVLESVTTPDGEITDVVEKLRRGAEERKMDIPCLGMVDFWSENVLVSRDGQGGTGLRCGLVDWEYFGPSSAPSELGMFLGNLHFHLLSTSSPTAKSRIQSFIDGMYGAYANTLGRGWKPTKVFMRRLLVSHGRELLNEVQVYEDKLEASTEIQLVAAGIRSFNAVGTASGEVDLSWLKPGGISAEPNNHVDIERVWTAFNVLRFH